MDKARTESILNCTLIRSLFLQAFVSLGTDIPSFFFPQLLEVILNKSFILLCNVMGKQETKETGGVFLPFRIVYFAQQA